MYALDDEVGWRRITACLGDYFPGVEQKNGVCLYLDGGGVGLGYCGFIDGGLDVGVCAVVEEGGVVGAFVGGEGIGAGSCGEVGYLGGSAGGPVSGGEFRAGGGGVGYSDFGGQRGFGDEFYGDQHGFGGSPFEAVAGGLRVEFLHRGGVYEHGCDLSGSGPMRATAFSRTRWRRCAGMTLPEVMVATAPWRGTGNTYGIYNPPARDWAFDLNFLDPSRLPPGTPEVRAVIRGGVGWVSERGVRLSLERVPEVWMALGLTNAVDVAAAIERDFSEARIAGRSSCYTEGGEGLMFDLEWEGVQGEVMVSRVAVVGFSGVGFRFILTASRSVFGGAVSAYQGVLTSFQPLVPVLGGG